MATHYETLGLERTATAQAVKAAFQAKMKALEGSGLPEPEKLASEKSLRAAFVTLFDPTARARYDKQLPPAGRARFVSQPVAPHEVAKGNPLAILAVIVAVAAAGAAGWFVTRPSAERLSQQRKEQAVREKAARQRLETPAQKKVAPNPGPVKPKQP